MRAHLVQDLVPLHADEVSHLVKIVVSQLASTVQLGAELASDLHDVLQHLVVVLAREKNLARVELIKRAADRPHVDGVVERHAQDELWSAVESADKIRHGLGRGCCGIGAVDCGAQIADLEHVLGFVHLGRGRGTG